MNSITKILQTSLDEGNTRMLFLDEDFHLREDGTRIGLLVLKSDDIHGFDISHEEWVSISQYINKSFRESGDDRCDFIAVAISGPDDAASAACFNGERISYLTFAQSDNVDEDFEALSALGSVDAQGNHEIPMEKSELALAMMATKSGEVH